ncbi:MAG TPA: gluconokinase [Candidatus Sulfotelmatobacter sp.]|nr:gluconokinase [Candidatus Sulfotelmatobacter sp.]
MILILMGVVGSGKTTVGILLAKELHWQFADADDFHSPENKDKIHRGIALTDEDRKPWLANLRIQIAQWIAANQNAVLACSALKRAYREELNVGPAVRFVYLKGNADLIESRLRARTGHFANDKILASQFEQLEEPDDAITVSIEPSPEQIAAAIRQKLSLS